MNPELPQHFADELRPLLGPERWQRFTEALTAERPVSIRLNPLRSVAPADDAVPVPWCQGGYWLNERPTFTFDPLLHAGCYYVQEAASMVIDHVVRQLGITQPVSGLDLCAAPGGKSSLLCAALPEGSIVVSNEPVPARAQVLLENMTKWGYAGSIVTSNRPEEMSKTGLLFDLILCDAPCSGEGMFRKEADALTTWSPRKVAECVTLQRDILRAAWRMLRPGGTLIYSTCTYNTHEDEEQLLWLVSQMAAEPLMLTVAPGWGCLGPLLTHPALPTSSPHGTDSPVLRFMPGFTQSEGLFCCAVRKPCNGNATPREKLLKTIGRQLKRLTPPTPTDTTRPSTSVDYPTALAYLRGEAVTLPADTPRGLVNIAYQGQVIGAAKNLGSRANNLYPKPWRIKSTHLPATPPVVVLAL